MRSTPPYSPVTPASLNPHPQYGVDAYAQGNDLRYIAMDAAAYQGPADKVEADAAGRKFVTAPDGYKYLLVDTGAKAVPKEPFLFVSIHVSDLETSKKVGGWVSCCWLLLG